MGPEVTPSTKKLVASGGANAADNISDPWRVVLSSVVSLLTREAGFHSADRAVVNTLVEMLQSLLIELGHSSRLYAEIAGRTEAFIGDTVLAMVDMGLPIQGLPEHIKRPNPCRPAVAPVSVKHHANTRALQIGEKFQHPPHIPDYLPPFPDPHTYIKTATHYLMSSEYESLREKAASQKRDVECALTKFIAKTGEVHGLFEDDPAAFPLIECQKSMKPYMTALLSKDQKFEDIDMEKDAEQTSGSGAEGIDNPYLRPVRLSRAKKRKL